MDMTNKPFMDEDFLLDTEFARRLFHDYAEKQPIIDYHCHIDPREIAEDKSYPSIADIWLAGDHYKWRAMRQCGYAEELITGKADERERFRAWADTLSQAVGSPLYHWSHLELQRYFDCRLPINAANADEIFDRCGEVLKSGKLSAKNIIKMSNVKVIGTTDDPCDDLKYHEMIAKDSSLGCRVIPTFRPDKLLMPASAEFPAYVEKLGRSAGADITDIKSLKAVLSKRTDWFAEHGCRSSDQSAAEFPCRRISEAEFEAIFAKALGGKSITPAEREGFVTELMIFLASEYARHGWVMQLHFGVARNTSSRMFELLGRDTGYDRIDSSASIEPLACFLDELEKNDILPKTVLYSLDPSKNAALDVLSKCFTEPGVRGKVQHGAAWWFNDNIGGMRDHLRSLCEQGVLGTFIGMLTDSRCMLSYTRHEYFRRILCQFIGRLAADGEIYPDLEALGRLVENVSFGNAMEFFGLSQ